MRALLQDVVYSHRFLRNRVGFTLAAALTLAVGIGASTAVVAVLYAALVRPLPVAAPDRVVLVRETDTKRGVARFFCSRRTYTALAERDDLFEVVSATYARLANLGGVETPATVRTRQIDAGFFALLGVAPVLGRGLRADETRPAAPAPVVVLGNALWRRQFAADPEIVGRVVMVDGQAVTIVGVMPPLEAWLDAGLFVPFQTIVTESQTRRMLLVFARLRADVPLVKARKAVETTANELGTMWPESHGGWTIDLTPLSSIVVGRKELGLLRVLAGAVLLVLLVACANLTSLLLARAVGRRREMAIHTALGAGRGRLIRRLLTEAMMLAVLGGGLGVLFALWGVDLFRRFGGGRFPRVDAADIGFTVLAAAAALTLLAGLVAGLLSARHAARAPVGDSLKEGGGSGVAGPTRQRVRTVLVIVEVALAVALLSGAGLLGRSLMRAVAVDPGLAVEHRYAVTVNLPPRLYQEDHRVVEFWRKALAGVRAVPGVISAGATSDRWLFANRRVVQFDVEGEPVNQRVPVAEMRTVTPGYFETLGIPLIEGRVFDETDQGTVQDVAPNEKVGFVAIVSKTLEARQWPGESAVGKRIRPIVGDNEHFWSTVIGVVDDIRQSAITESPMPTVYLSENQYAWLRLFLLVHTEGDIKATLPGVRKALLSVEPTLPADDVLPLEQLLVDSLAVERSMAIGLAAFAAAALLLAAVGVYGLIAYSVACRTQEFGVRMALGARRGDVLRLVLKDVLRVVAVGEAAGLLVALYLTAALRAFLFEVSSEDPASYAAAAATLLLAALAASIVPAWRAMAVDPAAALRAE